jgi:hypothetical protein
VCDCDWDEKLHPQGAYNSCLVFHKPNAPEDVSFPAHRCGPSLFWVNEALSFFTTASKIAVQQSSKLRNGYVRKYLKPKMLPEWSAFRGRFWNFHVLGN